MRTKKLLLLILTLAIFVMFSGCASDDTSMPEELVVYSFNGENDQFTVTGDLGKISGAEALLGTKIDDAQELQNNLYFEITTTNLNGEEKTYHLQLSLIRVTDEK